jgi:hypothetical protein
LHSTAYEDVALHNSSFSVRDTPTALLAAGIAQLASAMATKRAPGSPGIGAATDDRIHPDPNVVVADCETDDLRCEESRLPT